MKNIFRWDSPVTQTIMLVGNLVVLNILWIVCSIPVVTCGAATAAMYHTVFQFQTNDETTVLRPFFRAFAKNFKQATLLWLPLLAAMALMVFNVLYLFTYGGNTLLWVAVIVMSVVVLLMQTQLIPMAARFENKSMAVVKNSALLSILHFPSSLLMAALNVMPIVIFFGALNEFMRWLPLWVGLYFSLVAYLNGKMLLKLWAKHMPKEEEEVQADEAQ